MVKNIMCSISKRIINCISVYFISVKVSNRHYTYTRIRRKSCYIVECSNTANLFRGYKQVNSFENILVVYNWY